MQEWLLLVYKIPSEPSRYRAAVWRRIKSLGAVYLQNGVCVLPYGRDTERQFRMLWKEIEDYGGEAFLIRGTLLAPAEGIIKLFNMARDEEYAEIIDRCEDFFKEIEAETESRHFTYAELEENEEDLAKLEKWLKKVMERDFFQASLAEKTKELLQECRTRLDEFADMVFTCEDSMQKKP
ncbi:ChrB domain-containing protein [Desulfofundulus thermobenzoicus]|uniref:ChrB domain-containing protein n=1 Tax=Desulfofundulus thermobenzoicus TaxID=29376 RepID=A0A6N7IPW6_9FIRM|nr:Chromate resistance protein ChrB [Desulfofundulus thermobenzoicus]MQL51607.1 ChrB domain-containing protein [Desulfofundulus thermobenzoicus]